VRSGLHGIWLGQDIDASYAGDITLAQDIRIGMLEAVPAELAGSDSVGFVVYATGRLERGFICGLNITFNENYNDSMVIFDSISSWQRIYSLGSPKSSTEPSHAYNLSLLSYEHYMQGSGLKAFVALAGVNQPKSFYFDGSVYWELESPYSQAHQMEVDVDVVYYNGTVFKEVIQPFLLSIAPDNNNDFPNATEISTGNYTNLYVGLLDPVDYYKIYLNSGERLQVYAYGISSPMALFNIYVYDPDENLNAETSQLNVSQTLAFTADSAGYWFIQIQSDIPSQTSGYYNLEVSR
jgi:hypothetical protein